jgi:hypothetical protein
MEDKSKFNTRLNLKVPYKILSNEELSDNEKLILALDYTLSLKKGYNSYTNVYIGGLFSLHENIIGLCRKSLLKKVYLVKDTNDKQIHRLTNKLESVELPKIEEEETKNEIVCIIPFEIYHNPDLTTGSKLLWGEYNTMRNTKKGYFKKRETTSKIMNVSVGSITNWTKLLFKHEFLEVYTVNYNGYYKNQKVIRTIEFKREIEKQIDEVGDILDDGIKNDSSKEEVYFTLLPTEEKSDLEIEKKGKKSISEDIDFKESFDKKEEQKENLWDNPYSPLGGVTKFSDLPIGKKKKKNKHKDITDENPDLELI